MGLLNRILAVFNVLAAIGFVYLASADWSRRQAWAYTVMMYDLRIKGLPVDATDFTPGEDYKDVDRTTAALPDLFRGVPGNPVATQDDEVKQVHSDVRRAIDAITNQNQPEAARKKIAATLMPLAETSGERTQWARIIAQEPINTVMGDEGPLEKAFNQALNLKDKDARRLAIAQLLLGLAYRDGADAWQIVDVPNPDPKLPPAKNKMMLCTRLTPPDANWLQRVVTVVGAREFAQAANHQAIAFRDMQTPERLALVADRQAFVAQHNALTKVLRSLSAQLTDRKAELAARTAEKAKHLDIVNTRKEDLDKLQTQLEQTREALAAALKQQDRIEHDLFTAQQQVRDGQATNERLEKEIRTREKVGQ